MRLPNPTLLKLCNFAIPSNKILNKGLGDILRKNSFPEIDKICKDFETNYHEILCEIEKIISQHSIQKELTYPYIIEKTTLIFGKEKSFSFTQEFTELCAMAYFSNPLVLKTYNLLLDTKEKEYILNTELDKSIFLSLSKK